MADFPLSPEQRAVIDNFSSCSCVFAIPGAGKTLVIVEKIAKILHASEKHNVVAVTFTRKAAGELVERTAKRLVETGMCRFRAGTFHSLALWHLEQNKSAIGCQELPKFISGGQQRQFMRRALSEVEWKESIDEGITWIEAPRAKFYDRFESDRQKTAVAIYESMLERNNVMDFSKLMNWATELIIMGVIPHIPCSHLLVDEAQDIDEVQLIFILLHHENRVLIDMVGDDDQAIYGFRRSMGYKGMQEFMRATNADLRHLKSNYRCRKEILHCAGMVINQVRPTARMVKTLDAKRGSGGSYRIKRYKDRDDEAYFVALEIKARLYEANSPARRISQHTKRPYSAAILSRTNAVLDEMQAGMEAAGVPFYRSEGDSFWDQAPACFFLAFLRALDSDDECVGVDHALHEFGLNETDVRALSDQTNGDLKQALLGPVPDLKSLSIRSKEIFGRLRRQTLHWRKIANGGQDQEINKMIEQVWRFFSLEMSRASTAAQIERCDRALGVAARAIKKLKGPLSPTSAIRRCFSEFFGDLAVVSI